MAYQPVEDPVRGPDAFSQQDNRYVQSQAAILLLLRSQLVFAREYGQAQPAGDVTPARAGQEATSVLAEEDLQDFPVPWLRVTEYGTDGTDPINTLRGRFGGGVVDAILDRNPDAVAQILPTLGGELFEDPQPLRLALVLEVCLRHPDPLVRAAAGGTYLELSVGATRQNALDALLEGTRHDDPEVRDIAATMLGDSLPNHPRLAELAPQGLPGEGGGPLQTTLLIHGTWARNEQWWQPRGDFHDYILNNVRKDIYVGSDPFKWSGAYSDHDRAMGSLDLVNWVNKHSGGPVDTVIAHSHGANVAMMATWGGLEIHELVLLSCPVHQPTGFHDADLASLGASNRRYLPDFHKVASGHHPPGAGVVPRVKSIRVHLDWVISADRAHQRFHTHYVDEKYVGWFNHSITHDPDTWRRYDIDKWILNIPPSPSKTSSRTKWPENFTPVNDSGEEIGTIWLRSLW